MPVSIDAQNIAVNAPPLNGQVLFSQLTAHISGQEVTATLTAASGTTVNAGGVRVTVDGGTINLLPGRILHGELQAHAASGGGSHSQATVGWTHNVFNWSAEGEFELGEVTGGQLLGRVRAAAGSGGAGSFESIGGSIRFAIPALSGVAISNLRGNRRSHEFHAQVQAGAALERLTRGIDGVHITGIDAPITVD
jgi:hypothetical protein